MSSSPHVPSSQATHSDVPAIDMIKLCNDEFDVEKCQLIIIFNAIATQSEESVIRAFRTTLQGAKEEAATNLKKNVFANYQKFVIISKEIKQLESSVLTLHGLLNELKLVNANFKYLEAGGEDAESNDANATDKDEVGTKVTVDDSSVTITKQIMDAYGKHYNNIEDLVRARGLQMAQLYENVEGLTKFIPDGRGKYIARDGSNNTKIYELNPTTLKQKPQALSFFLLNDTLILVSKKKMLMSGGKNKLVADKCFLLSEIATIDVKDSESTNSFKIMKHPETYFYRFETPEEKRSFLLLLKKVSDEFMSSRKKTTCNVEEEKKSLTVKTSTVKMPFSGDNSVQNTQTEKTKKKEDSLSPQQIKFLEELPDDLEVLIAHRDFELGVILSEKAIKTFELIQIENQKHLLLRITVEEKISRLSGLIGNELARPFSTKKSVQANICLLLRLGFGEQARDIFLGTRSITIRQRIRQLKFDGNIANYICDLSEVVFRVIKNTSDWYGGSFQETFMASGFMKWVRLEIESYGSIFRKQVFESKQNFRVISKCIEFTMHHCKQLKEVGLDLSFVLDKLFFFDIGKAIDAQASLLNEVILRSFLREEFVLCAPKGEFEIIWKKDFGIMKQNPLLIFSFINFAEGTDMKFTRSVYELYKLLIDFGDDMSLVISVPLYGRVVSALKAFFATYINRMLELFENMEWKNKQYYAMMVNGNFIVDLLIPKISLQLSKIRFDRPIPELEEQRLKLKTVVLAMHGSFIRLSTVKLITKDYNFPNLDYSSSASILDVAKPSEYILNLIKELNNISVEMDPSLNKRAILQHIVERLFEIMTERML
ncbi:exocyst complex component exo84 [Clydaea vesicula]|uniref:Exocyst complex component EXO84 n=1 Tax=Clydaea vesicula TaxID=447962 RepID=A0AAD5U1Q7_9FUNG|nr:exocyst complex component exo84 [Clydaea vesicula]